VSVQAIMLWASALTAPRALNPRSIKISKSINTKHSGGQDCERSRAVVNRVMNLRVPESGEFLDKIRNY